MSQQNCAETIDEKTCKKFALRRTEVEMLQKKYDPDNTSQSQPLAQQSSGYTDTKLMKKFLRHFDYLSRHEKKEIQKEYIHLVMRLSLFTMLLIHACNSKSSNKFFDILKKYHDGI